MKTTNRLNPALCVDCGHPISERAIRCRPCAARAGVEPISRPEPEPAVSPMTGLGPEEVAWIRANGRRYNAARLALVFGVAEEQIRWILEATGAE